MSAGVVPGMRWQVAAGSAVGSSHRAVDLPNQDAVWSQCFRDRAGQECLIAVVADGAGSAARADLGAEAAVDAVGDAAGRWWTDTGRGALDEAVLAMLVEQGALALQQLAKDLQCPVRELSCTLLLAVVTPQACGFAQLGDGVMVYADPQPQAADPVLVAFWPQAGEFANVTEFLSDTYWATHLRCRVVEPPPRRLALLSDGLQRLALRLADQRAHAPFFQPFWDALAALPASEQSAFAAQLRDWLGSALVESRTDDDKTLLLAVAVEAA